MPPPSLDPNTTDRLLRGAVQPDDAPPGYAEVARIVQAVTAEPSPGELAGRDRAVAAMADVMRSRRSTGRAASRAPNLLKVRIAALLVGVSMLSGTSLAVAGALPAPAQNAASTLLGKVGVSVPRHADRPAILGPARFGLCTPGGGIAGDRFEAAPFQKFHEATQVAGQTLKEFCAGVTARGHVPGVHRAPTPNPGAAPSSAAP